MRGDQTILTTPPEEIFLQHIRTLHTHCRDQQRKNPHYDAILSILKKLIDDTQTQHREHANSTELRNLYILIERYIRISQEDALFVNTHVEKLETAKAQNPDLTLVDFLDNNLTDDEYQTFILCLQQVQLRQPAIQIVESEVIRKLTMREDRINTLVDRCEIAVAELIALADNDVGLNKLCENWEKTLATASQSFRDAQRVRIGMANKMYALFGDVVPAPSTATTSSEYSSSSFFSSTSDNDSDDDTASADNNQKRARSPAP